jgi:ABC-type transporter Mla subunit MlaD
MKKVLLILAAAALSAGPAFTGSALAQNRDRADRTAPSVNQIVAEEDAHTARIKADLRLTPDQEKNWPGFESALHDIATTRADRIVALQAESGQRKDSGDAIEHLNRRARSLADRSDNMKKLADAAEPLYASLDERQKRRFANELIHLSRERDSER